MRGKYRLNYYRGLFPDFFPSSLEDFPANAGTSWLPPQEPPPSLGGGRMVAGEAGLPTEEVVAASCSGTRFGRPLATGAAGTRG